MLSLLINVRTTIALVFKTSNKATFQPTEKLQELYQRNTIGRGFLQWHRQ